MFQAGAASAVRNDLPVHDQFSWAAT